MMFSIFKLKDSTPLNDRESVYLMKMLQRYSVTRQGLWLQELDYRKFQFLWCPGMLSSGGVMGCFSPLFQSCVFLLPSGEPEVLPQKKYDVGRCYWVEQLFPTIIHELRHAYQWEKSKFAYILFALPVIRQFTLEYGANKAQKECADFLRRWTTEWDYREAAERGMAEQIILEKEENYVS